MFTEDNDRSSSIADFPDNDVSSLLGPNGLVRFNLVFSVCKTLGKAWHSHLSMV